MECGGRIIFGSGIHAQKLNVVAKSGKTIKIGDSCLFAPEVIIRNNDGHPILHLNTNEIINPPEDVIIENNVWFGTRSMVLKGSYVSEGSIIASMALVNKKFKQKNIIIGGVPAKILKENIYWEMKNYDYYLMDLKTNSQL